MPGVRQQTDVNDPRPGALALRVRKALEQAAVRQGRLLAAVSGGADSTAMLLLLCDVARHADLEIAACYVHHGLREEAAFEQRFVRDLAESLRIEFVAERIDSQGRRDEGTLRKLRYAALRRAAGHTRARWIATAHSADDQIETVVLRMLRGAGRRGLGGIPARSGELLRPVLDIGRAELREELGRRGQGWCEDAHNRDPRYLRNRVRAEVLPMLRATFGEGAVAHLPETARRLAAEDALLEELAARELERGTAGDGALDLDVLQSVAPALRPRVLRGWAVAQGLTGTPELRHVRILEHLAAGRQGSGQVDLPGVQVVREYHWLRAVGTRGDGTWSFDLDLETTGAPSSEVSHPQGFWSLGVCGIEGPHEAGCGTSELAWPRAWSRHCPRLRPPRPGDRIRRHAGTRKLQDVFVDARVPRSLRGHWPVLEYGTEVVWVPGLAVARTVAEAAREGARARLLWRPGEGLRVVAAPRRA
jgi:tRNA(Ile)-lysidine synthase